LLDPFHKPGLDLMLYPADRVLRDLHGASKLVLGLEPIDRGAAKSSDFADLRQA
jgi:hypothetical protein